MDLFTAGKNNNNSTGVSYTSGFFMLIGIALIMTFVAGLLIIAFLGSDPAAFKDPANADKIRLAQAVNVVIGFIFPAIVVAAMLNRKPFALLGFDKEARIKQVGIVIGIAFLSVFIAGGLGLINRDIPVSAEWKLKFDNWEKAYMEQVALILNLKNFGGYLMSLLIMAVLPAIGEEVLFRGGLQNFLSRATRRPWLSIIIVSVLFSVIHFSFYGFLPRVFLGVMLGAIFYYTGNIWLAIAAHFFNNALAVTSAFVLTKQGKGLEEALNEDVSGAYWGLLAIPVVIVLFNALRKTVTVNEIQSTT